MINILFIPKLKNKKILVSTSGGMDSQLLAFYISKLEKQSFFESYKPELLYIHHQTRPEEEHQKDIQAIKENSHLKLNIEKIKEKISSNTEKKLRDRRKKIYKKYSDYLILQAHHLDDAFEWHLMQKFKSSEQPKSIPKESENIFRPFLEISKEEIKREVIKEKVIYHEDKTNHDLSFERNFMRNVIIKNIKEKYPSYLKNFLAQEQERKRSIENESKLYLLRKKNYHLIKVSENISRQVVFESIKEFSNHSRGTLREQFEKLEVAIKNKSQGPLVFSGGVRVYLFRNFLFVSREDLSLCDVEFNQSKTYTFDELQVKAEQRKSANDFEFEDLFIGGFRKVQKGESLKLPKSFSGITHHFSKALEREPKVKIYEISQLLQSWSKQGKYKTKSFDFFTLKLNFSSHL